MLVRGYLPVRPRLCRIFTPCISYAFVRQVLIRCSAGPAPFPCRIIGHVGVLEFPLVPPLMGCVEVHLRVTFRICCDAFAILASDYIYFSLVQKSLEKSSFSQLPVVSRAFWAAPGRSSLFPSVATPLFVPPVCSSRVF